MRGTAPILIVDDDPGLRALLAATLELEGHVVMTAADGAIALDVIQEREPLLILLDKSMPRLDGPGFVRELRARGFTTPIVVISGSDGAGLFARDIKAFSFIRKPFKVPQLIATVEDLISRFGDNRRDGSQPATG
jgi:DNA-binding response OmpR family regulator